MPRRSQPKPEPVGDLLRRQRIGTLGLGLREMARALNIAPAHLTDLEKGRRSPSEDLLVKIAKAYGIEVATLRSGWSKPDAVVKEIASQDPTAAAMVPELLRSAKGFAPDQWTALIEHAKRLSKASR